METLARLKEREFLFVNSEDRNKFKSILYAIQEKKSIALAHNCMETKEYRKEVQELYEYVVGVQASLISDKSYTRPHIYTGLIERIKHVVSTITASQPEAIFRLMNKFLVIILEIERLVKKLRD